MLVFDGEVPERSKGADCKSVGSAFEGPNPSLSITMKASQELRGFLVCKGCALAWYDKGICFTCLRCSHCCSGEPGYVFISGSDADRISSYLSMKRDEFLSSHTRLVDMGTYYQVSLKERDNYDCEFLTDKGCSIYEVRPLQCRTYPFWPHVFDDKALFEEEKKACPGLGKGELRSAAEIREGIHSTLMEKLLTIVK